MHANAAPHAHAVQFYEEYPADAIANVLSAGLLRGNGLLIIATADHRAALDRALLERSTEDTLRRQSVWLDATALADHIVRDGAPDPAWFREQIGACVDGLLARFGRARVYGEVVDVLWQRGLRAAALALERLWGGLLSERPLELLCGYALAGFDEASSVEGFQRVCDAHAELRSMTGLPALPSGSLRLQTELQQRSAALSREGARRRALEQERDRLAEAERRSSDRLRFLSDASARFSAARLDLEQVLESVVTEVTSRLSEGCAVHLLSNHDQTLDLAALRYADPEAEEASRALMAAAPLKVGQGLIGGVVQTGKARLISSLDEATILGARAEYHERLRRRSIRSLVIVPLRASGRILGALTAGRRQGSAPFTAEDQALLQEFADRAALAIANALLYAEAERERRRAEQANRTKDEFLAMLGHELRNPLSPILTALELLKLRGASSARQREHDVIERQVRVMVRLIDDLLDVSRVAQGKVTLRKERVEAAAVVAKAIEMASPLLEQRRHQLAVSAPAEGLSVHGDEARLSQVVANLLINAAKYTSPGGHIAVEVAGEGNRVTIRVRDDGVGIPAEILPRLFNLFFQAERALDRAPGGLGIGLTVARSLVELHGGTISAHSEGPGRGSEFTIRLPAAVPTDGRGAAERAEAKAAGAAPARRRDNRLLVVDDNRDAADALGEALTEIGYTVEVAYDGPSALALASRFRPAVALLDIGLPAMDGYELAARLREMPDAASLRLVAVTGYGQEEDRARARAAGFHAHVVKPVELALVKSLVEAELEAWQGSRTEP